MLVRWAVIFFGCLLLMNSCATIEDSGRAYFRSGNNVSGVEPAEAMLERLDKDQQLRKIAHGELKAEKIVQCTFLRNQLYVAAVKGPRTQQVLDAVKIMESAYQDTDDAFLATCDQISKTPLGQTFLNIQQEYLRIRR
jgi:hypothetical protein